MTMVEVNRTEQLYEMLKGWNTEADILIKLGLSEHSFKREVKILHDIIGREEMLTLVRDMRNREFMDIVTEFMSDKNIWIGHENQLRELLSARLRSKYGEAMYYDILVDTERWTTSNHSFGLRMSKAAPFLREERNIDIKLSVKYHSVRKIEIIKLNCLQ